MSFAGSTPTKFGRRAIAEPFRAATFHAYAGEPLKEVDHEPPVPVMDQEDLIEQGIDTATLVPGAREVDALGSCTANASTASMSQLYSAVHGVSALASIGISTTNAVEDEEYAIVFYHDDTMQTRDTAEEWPPTDGGSTGLACCQEMISRGLAVNYKSASEPLALASLIQGGTVIVGLPWFEAWMQPDPQGFVDGAGSLETLMRAIESGVAGGHETCMSALEKLTLTATGQLELDKTWYRVRNSWSDSFGDHGSYRIHASTLAMLGSHADFKQFVVAAA